MKSFLRSALRMGATLAAAAAPIAAYAQDAVPVVANEGFLLTGLEIVNMVLALVAVIIIALVIKQFGSSLISVIFWYFLIGTILLASSRLMIFLVDLGVLQVSDDMLHISWHVLFYLSMLTFILAGRGFAQLAQDVPTHKAMSRVLGWGLAMGILALAIFLGSGQVDTSVVGAIEQTVLEQWGFIHFIAFVLGGAAGFTLYKQAKTGEITRSLAVPYLISLSLLGLNHLWELIAESWQLIVLPSSTIETVEQFFIVPAFLLIAYAYIRLWTLIRSRA